MHLTVYPNGDVCISILVSTISNSFRVQPDCTRPSTHPSTRRVTISTGMRMQGNDGCPSTASSPLSVSSHYDHYRFTDSTYSQTQLLSVISLLSSETPNLDSPANVDAAKEVRTDFAGLYRRLLDLSCH